MKILFFETLPSTQLYLKELVKSSQLSLPVAVVSQLQTMGVGSRDNSWVSKKGNIFLSFAINLQELPIDLKFESASIYFSYILKETLQSFGADIIVKWPNDLYFKDKKIAGMITNIVNEVLVCGVGVNVVNSLDEYANIDLNISNEKIIESYFKNIEKKMSWKQVFSKYKLEFQTNKNFSTHIKGIKTSLSEAVLENDGSLNINGERIYSLR